VRARQARSPRSPSRPRRGRSVVALVLVGFVLVAAAVIWRRGYGMARGMELRELDRHRVQLVAQRASLERELEELTGRARLGAIAEQQLGMHVPADSQMIVLPAPPVDPAPPGSAPPPPPTAHGAP